MGGVVNRENLNNSSANSNTNSFSNISLLGNNNNNNNFYGLGQFQNNNNSNSFGTTANSSSNSAISTGLGLSFDTASFIQNYKKNQFNNKTNANTSTGSTDSSTGTEGENGGSKDVAGTIAAVGGTAVDFANNWVGNVSQKSVNDAFLQKGGADRGMVDNSSTQSLLDSWNSVSTMQDASAKDFRDKSKGEEFTDTLKTTVSGATTGAQIGGPWGAAIGGIIGLGSGLASMFVGRKKARENAAKLQNKISAENFYRNQMKNEAAETLADQRRSSLTGNANFSAYGGRINNIYSNGGTIRQVKEINTGGTHEENPNSGIQIGTDPQGVPNLVEQGEVIYQNYVYSNRIQLPEELKAEYSFGKRKTPTFADAAKKVIAEVKERPNDPISLNTMDARLKKLSQKQELIKQQQEFAQIAEQAKAMGIAPQELYAILEQSKQEQMMQEQRSQQGQQEDPMNQQEDPMTAQQDQIDPSMQQPQMAAFGGQIGRSNRYAYGTQDLQLMQDNVNNSINSFKDFSKGLTTANYNYTPNVSKVNLGVNASLPYNKVFMPGISNPTYGTVNGATNNEDLSGLKLGNTGDVKYSPNFVQYGGAAIDAGMALSNIFQKPDYSIPNQIISQAASLNTPVHAEQDGTRLTPHLEDINQAQNNLNSIAGGTRNAILNSSNGNAAAAAARLIAADYNAQNASGSALLQGIKANNQAEQQAAQFNSAVRRANIANALNAQQQNFARRQAYLNQVNAGLQLKQQIDQAKAQAVQQSLGAIASDLSEIGQDINNRRDRDFLIRSGVYGTIGERMPGESKTSWLLRDKKQRKNSTKKTTKE